MTRVGVVAYSKIVGKFHKKSLLNTKNEMCRIICHKAMQFVCGSLPEGTLSLLGLYHLLIIETLGSHNEFNFWLLVLEKKVRRS
jgi:hypothetical protein